MGRAVLYSDSRLRKDGNSASKRDEANETETDQTAWGGTAGRFPGGKQRRQRQCVLRPVCGQRPVGQRSTYVGRSEDIGKLYDKVFEVRPAADHAEGEVYEDTYGFSMPYPAHTYRYTVMRDSIEQGESVLDEDGNLVREAYGEVGMNEKGVSVSATVSTAYNTNASTADPLVGTGICEISLASVILMSADSARDGVEKLAAIIDTYGSGECNSFTISDANEVWDFETLSRLSVCGGEDARRQGVRQPQYGGDERDRRVRYGECRLPPRT